MSGQATLRADEAIRSKIPATAASIVSAPVSDGRLVSDHVAFGSNRVPLTDLGPIEAMGSCDGLQRAGSVNVQGFRIAVQPSTGSVRVLQSVHAADAGRVINPMQCRGQIEGGIAQALGAALYEEVAIDPTGKVSTTAFRSYHIRPSPMCRERRCCSPIPMIEIDRLAPN